VNTSDAGLLNSALNLRFVIQSNKITNMAKYELYLPAMGEGVIEATITKWLKKEGDRIEEDESVVEVATDKVDSEIPSSHTGIIARILFNEGDVPKVGDVLAIIVTEGEQVSDQEAVEKKTPAEPAVIHTVASLQQKEVDAEEDSPNAFGSRTPGGRFLTPLVRNIANKEGIGLSELDNLTGTGQDGRLTKKDILEYLTVRGKEQAGVLVGKRADQAVFESESLVKAIEPLPVRSTMVETGPDTEIIPMDRMRRLIAEHMVHSKSVSPHVTSFVEVDVTHLVEWRNRVKGMFEKREGEKLTFTPVFVEAAARALRDFPMVNVSVDGTNIIRKKRINIGMATALPNGNLIVPVIRDADRLSIVGLAKSVNDLAGRARAGKLKPDEIQGGTFTITNFGSFDNITGTPIINQPEVAILGVGAIKKKPAVVETPQGDFIAIRHIMILSLSYDHRVVDGALGGMFLKRVGDYLEQWDGKRTV
jgi:2-oxoglutarate dehydrogenase E2 component (dihydrolipoamide succinyltransferase)